MEFLLEINTEEMPPSYIDPALAQLKERLEDELGAARIAVKKIEMFGTCRRLVMAGDFAPEQEDKVEEVIGPPKAAAMTPDGTFTDAAKGFARSQGVAVNRLEVIQRAKGEYLGLKTVFKGRTTSEVLAEALPRMILSLNFPKMMRWGENALRFSRPIKNILCLFDHKLLPFSVDGIASTDFTTGHRMFFPDRVKVKSLADYKRNLKKKKVILEREARQQMILEQAQKKLAPLEAKMFPDEELLEKLTNDVEFPLVILGTFPDKYLSLPIEVLSTAMREGQNLFAVIKGKKQLAYFIGVADAYKDAKKLIQKGNERVLKARLDDANFFWEQDLKTPLKQNAARLDRVIFQEELGTYQDKMQRLKSIAGYLADKLEAKKQKKSLVEAAEICKADLVTEMVKEFPSLQGKMGGLYAQQEKMPADVWRAVYEQYQPVSLEDEVPASLTGAVLSIADKMDSIVGVLGIGVEVTGSKDPFGLRRQAQGVCKVILEKKMNFSFTRLVEKVLKVYGQRFEKRSKEVRDLCLGFFTGRLQHIFEKQGFRYDLVKAALSPRIDNIFYCSLKLKALDGLKGSAQFEPLILIAKRVNNILRGQPSYKVNPDLFFEKEERELYTTFTIIKNNIGPMILKGDFANAQKIVLQIRSIINSFFDHVLVMAEDTKLRRNRLALLQVISRMLNQIVDYSQVVLEGEKADVDSG